MTDHDVSGSEVTSAMIEAGGLAYVRHDPENYTLDEIAVAIWSAMAAVKRTEVAGEGCRRPYPTPS